ncbi:MAG: cell filamentation protein Fic [Betaproteobacteria bacterium]|nr:MAG: cell filamentation protein Fic [Betaproteobacteria bacterium]
MSAANVVKKFGGQTALSLLIRVNQSAIAYWVKKGTIPAKWHTQLLELAQRQGVDLSPADLVGSPIAITESALQDVTPAAQLEATGDNSQLSPIPNERESGSHFLFYGSDDGTVKVQVILGDETVWASQKGMAEIFGTTRENVTTHLGNVFRDGELDAEAVSKEFLLTASDGKNYKYKMYNLDAIISIGYRVNSYQATQFRKWATTVLREYLIKGFTLDDDRLKQGNQMFGKDYFDELLERIREIRASERRFYQKITDIYAQCSIDYDKDSPVAQKFYAYVQDKLHYAIHGHTAAELIQLRADASKPNMGLYSYKNEKTGGKVTKYDVTVGKNYLDQKEIEDLNRLVSMYLDFAENFARRHIAMKMQDWSDKLDDFLAFNAYEVLDNHGRVRRDTAENRAFTEYEKYRVIQDQKYRSDFDKIVDEVRTKKKLPKRVEAT